MKIDARTVLLIVGLLVFVTMVYSLFSDTRIPRRPSKKLPEDE